MSTVIQYVLVRSDLIKTFNWPLGALIAQACHASVAVTHIHYLDEFTQKYLENLDHMHKVILELPNEEELRMLEKTLLENNILHKVWIEHPENIPTCIAVKPYPKNDVQNYFKKYKLFKSL